MMLIESSESIKDCYVDVGRWAITYYFVELKDHFCTGCRVFRESQLMHFCFNPKKKGLERKLWIIITSCESWLARREVWCTCTVSRLRETRALALYTGTVFCLFRISLADFPISLAQYDEFEEK